MQRPPDRALSDNLVQQARLLAVCSGAGWAIPGVSCVVICSPFVMHTISGVVPFLVAHVARSLAADPEPLLRGSGVDAAVPARGDEHIDVERYFDVWRRAMALFDDAFPLRVASFFRHEDNEIFGFLAMRLRDHRRGVRSHAPIQQALHRRGDIADGGRPRRDTIRGVDPDDVVDA